MSERKVLTKYYPPDFDPSKLERRRGPKQTGPKQQTVRLMAPFSMKCTSCGEFIYKGRKFNARKETTDEKYYAISIFRFYIRCTRCSAEITFKTDPKNMDYTCEKGAKRNFEPWREAKLAEETEEERLDRIQREEDERDAMKELEKKTMDAKTEMAIADALDDVRHRNAARERVDKDGVSTVPAPKVEEEAERIERELEEQARMAFQSSTGDRVRRIGEEDTLDDDALAMPPPPLPTFSRTTKAKKDFGASLGIKKKPAEMSVVETVAATPPAPVPAAAPAVTSLVADSTTVCQSSGKFRSNGSIYPDTGAEIIFSSIDRTPVLRLFGRGSSKKLMIVQSAHPMLSAVLFSTFASAQKWCPRKPIAFRFWTGEPIIEILDERWRFKRWKWAGPKIDYLAKQRYTVKPFPGGMPRPGGIHGDMIAARPTYKHIYDIQKALLKAHRRLEKLEKHERKQEKQHSKLKRRGERQEKRIEHARSEAAEWRKYMFNAMVYMVCDERIDSDIVRFFHDRCYDYEREVVEEGIKDLMAHTINRPNFGHPSPQTDLAAPEDAPFVYNNTASDIARPQAFSNSAQQVRPIARPVTAGNNDQRQQIYERSPRDVCLNTRTSRRP